VKKEERELRPLRGVIPPMVTPLTLERKLDVEGLERLVAHILGGGVHGLFALGTTGEAPDLPYDVRRELVERTCALVAGRVPVLVGITDTVSSESLRMDVPRVRALQDRVMLASSLLYGIGHHNSSFVKGVKCALSLMGICSDALAEPREPFNAEDRAKIRAGLVRLGVLAQ